MVGIRDQLTTELVIVFKFCRANRNRLDVPVQPGHEQVKRTQRSLEIDGKERNHKNKFLRTTLYSCDLHVLTHKCSVCASDHELSRLHGVSRLDPCRRSLPGALAKKLKKQIIKNVIQNFDLLTASAFKTCWVFIN